MKTKIVFVIIVTMLLCGAAVGYGLGNILLPNTCNEKYYENVLSDTFPIAEGSHIEIVLRNGSYFVYHNTTEKEYYQNMEDVRNNGGLFFLQEITTYEWLSHGIFQRAG